MYVGGTTSEREAELYSQLVLGCHSWGRHYWAGYKLYLKSENSLPEVFGKVSCGKKGLCVFINLRARAIGGSRLGYMQEGSWLCIVYRRITLGLRRMISHRGKLRIKRRVRLGLMRGLGYRH